jgi:hypothetical protein
VIVLAPAFHARLLRELRRAVGNDGRLAFFAGKMPLWPDDPAEGERVASREASERDLELIISNREPDLVEGSTFWRLLDNGGLVLMQGDGRDG